MSKGKKVELQVTVQSQDQWEELLQRDGLIVVDAYSAWCGPCKAMVSTLRRIKNEIGDNLLHFATAETDCIDSLSLYRGKSQPTFLFYANGTLVYVIRGCNCPVITKTIKSQLDKEHKVLEGKAERIAFIDKEVSTQQSEEKKDELKEFNEEEEEIEVPKEVSLAIIKPDAVKAGLVDEIIAKVEAEGLEILRKEERTLTKEEAAEFYKQHESSEHFEELVEFMSSGPCLTLIISKGGTGDGVIPQFRDLIGPKDVNKAKEEAPTSIRALYGTSSVMNAIHACDTSESAARELAFFFPNFVTPPVKTKKPKQRSQRTLALIRPDALLHHKDSIIAKVKEAGFSIAMAKELTLTREEAEDFYSEHKDKDFFEPLVNNMCSGPVMALCLAREDAVEGWRHLLGPKEVDVATQEAPDSLRAQFRVDDSDFNPLHGSDSQSAADREIEKIFPVETTVAVIKPETALENGDAIINRIKESGFRIISRKDVGLTKELATQFYHEHAGKDFFGGLTDYMSSGQSTVLLLEREDAVSGWRAMMGPTDPDEAREKAPDSIRAVFGKDIVRNAVHGSSNVEKAGKVIEELFPDVELLPNGRAIGQETKEDSGEKDGQDAEKERLVTEGDGQVTEEDGQVTKEDGQVIEKDSQGNEDDHVTEEDGQVIEKDSQGNEDDHVTEEDGQVSENGELVGGKAADVDNCSDNDGATDDVPAKDDGSEAQGGSTKDSADDGETINGSAHDLIVDGATGSAVATSNESAAVDGITSGAVGESSMVDGTKGDDISGGTDDQARVDTSTEGVNNGEVKDGDNDKIPSDIGGQGDESADGTKDADQSASTNGSKVTEDGSDGKNDGVGDILVENSNNNGDEVKEEKG